MIQAPNGGWPAIIRAVAIAVCSLSSVACSVSPCRLTRLTAQPAADRPGEFIAAQGRLEVIFHSDSTTAPIEVFPEPPVIVTDTVRETECRIEEGGIWIRDAVYVSKLGQTLMLKEYSGSNDWLAFYRTDDCVKIAEIDVSGARWAVVESRVVVGSDCSNDDLASCRSVRSIDLDGACRAPAGSNWNRKK